MSDFSNLPRIIEAADLAPRLAAPELILVDLGSATRYAERHIPGARHLDIARTHRGNSPTPGLLPDMDALEKLFGELGHRADAVYVAYDDDGGTAAGRFLWLLDVIGHPQWHLLNGSLPAWLEEDRPLSQEAPPPSAATALPSLRLQEGPTATREYLQARLGAADRTTWVAAAPPNSAARPCVQPVAATYPAPSTWNGTAGLTPSATNGFEQTLLSGWPARGSRRTRK